MCHTTNSPCGKAQIRRTPMFLCLHIGVASQWMLIGPSILHCKTCIEKMFFFHTGEGSRWTINELFLGPSGPLPDFSGLLKLLGVWGFCSLCPRPTIPSSHHRVGCPCAPAAVACISCGCTTSHCLAGKLVGGNWGYVEFVKHLSDRVPLVFCKIPFNIK